MKGVILAGGTGSRLDPLTRITNKHLLPVYDRPMVTYPIESLVRAGVTEAMLVTGGTHAGEFLRLLGNGHEWGLDRLLYAYQERPGALLDQVGKGCLDFAVGAGVERLGLAVSWPGQQVPGLATCAP